MQEKGISLIVTFLIMTVLLAVVLGLITILFSQSKSMVNLLNSKSSFYAADSGIEKTYYLEKASRSFCNICSFCTDCLNCTLAPLVIGGCSLNTCGNCKLTYSSTFDNRDYSVEASVTPYINPEEVNFCVKAKGFYKDTVIASRACKTIPQSSPSVMKSPQSANTRAGDIGGVSWSKASQALTQDNRNASVSISSKGTGAHSNYLVLTEFVFNIPFNAAITGVKVDIDRSAGTPNVIADYRVILFDDSSGKHIPLGSNKANTGVFWPTTDTNSYVVYGGPNDKWGANLTPAVVNKSTFGIGIAAQRKTTSGTAKAIVDHVQATVYYSTP